MFKKIIVLIVTLLLIFFCFHFFKKPLIDDNWPEPLSVLSISEFNENKITIKNIRNFRYGKDETEIYPAYYDKTYNLDKLKKVWYVFEPFDNVAHSFLSFEFEDNIFLTISIEARTNKSQIYNSWVGLFRSYPLIYVVSDERDAILMRTNIRKNEIILYPMTLSQKQGIDLLVGMLEEANNLRENPKWYNTVTANCTSLVFDHFNTVLFKPIPYSWKLLLTGYSDDLAFDNNLIDTSLNLEEAMIKYNITDKSRQIGDNPDYSVLIRQGIE